MIRVLKTVWSALCVVFCLSCQSQQESPIQTIDKATLNADVIGKNVQFIDVRTAKEFESGHIDDAINIDVNSYTFQDEISKLDKDEPVYLYCKKGARSNKAAHILKNLGFIEIYDFKGGYDNWILTE